MESCATAPYSLEKPEWLVFLCTLCAFAEGTLELIVGVNQTLDPRAAATCILTVLKDSLCRIAVMGGRDHMPRSLGSVYAGAVTRFLDGFRGRCTRTIATPSAGSYCNGVAVSRGGSTLLFSDEMELTHAICVFSVHPGALLQRIGSNGTGPLQFKFPSQVWVASDGFVFVADSYNYRIQVLTPEYEFHAFVGVGQLHTPRGVCANDDCIVVAEDFAHRVSVLNRHTGARVCQFGSRGHRDGQLYHPAGVCFMAGNRHVAVADSENARVSVWTLKGEFVRHVGVDKLEACFGVACSDADELIVADLRHIFVLAASGEIVWKSKPVGVSGIAMNGCTIYARTRNQKCIVFS